MLATDQVEYFFATAPQGMRNAFSAALPEHVAIVIELDGDMQWAIVQDKGTLRIERQAPTQVDCRLRCTTQDFLDLIEGRMDGVRGFLEGRLDLEGDVGLVLRLQQVVKQNTPQ